MASWEIHNLCNLPTNFSSTQVESPQRLYTICIFAVICNMVGQKNKNIYRKKRKGKPFSGKQRYSAERANSTEGESSRQGENKENENGCSTPNQSEQREPLPTSASRRKLKLSKESEKAALETTKDVSSAGQGYRLIDIQKLTSSMSKAHVCEEGKLLSSLILC